MARDVDSRAAPNLAIGAAGFVAPATPVRMGATARRRGIRCLGELVQGRPGPDGGDTMRRVAFAFVCSLLSGPVLGATGDVLTVLGDQVNVRAGPGTDSGVVMQVSRNRRLVEIGRQGDWVHVEITGAGGATGWVHDSLVATPHRETLVPPAAPDSTADQATMGPGAAAGSRPRAPGPAQG